MSQVQRYISLHFQAKSDAVTDFTLDIFQPVSTFDVNYSRMIHL